MMCVPLKEVIVISSAEVAFDTGRRSCGSICLVIVHNNILLSET
jgi:hypothetical protein